MERIGVPLTVSSPDRARRSENGHTPATRSEDRATPTSALMSYRAQSRRRILCVFPKYTHSFGTFDHAFPLMNVRAFMPPQGLLVLAAALPCEWEVRLVD